MNIIEKIKFKFWDLSNKSKLIKALFNLIAIVYSYYSFYRYKKKVRSFDYDKRYSVKNIKDCQFLIFKDIDTDKSKLIGVIHVLNHIGVPFKMLSKNELKKKQYELLKFKVIIFFDLFDDIKNINHKMNKLVFLNKSYFGKNKNITKISSCPSQVLPHEIGLLSEFTAEFIKSLLDTKFPIITNFFKSDIGFLIDDVKNDFDYKLLLKFKWKLLLSIFVNDFFKIEKIKEFRKKIYKEEIIDISPHSFSETDFLYYDFSKGQNLTRKEFSKLWNKVKEKFKKSSFKLSTIISSHFHLMSLSCVSILLKDGVKCYLCDIEPGKKEISYNKKFLPYGDSSLSTGNLNSRSLFQIYSGSPSQCSKMKNSFYDFLEGDFSKKELIDRLRYNLDIMIYSGFPIYLRTHEYNLIKRSNELKDILKFLDSYLQNQKFLIKKEKLSEISEKLIKKQTNFIKKINIKKKKINIFCKKNKNTINIFYKNRIIDYKNFKKIKNNYEII